MSLVKYFTKQPSASALHSETDLTNKDECFQWAMKKKSKNSVAGRYNKYMPEEQAFIWKYAAENGSTKGAQRFSRLLNSQRMLHVCV